MSENVSAALLAAQREFPKIAKDKVAKIETSGGGSYSYSYADLGSILEAVTPILHTHGLALAQDPVSEGAQVGVSTSLIHESGEALHFGALLLPAGKTPQSVGSAVTYARRYALAAVLGLNVDDDDDGQRASESISEAEQVERAANALKAKILSDAGGDRDAAVALWEGLVEDHGEPKTMTDITKLNTAWDGRPI